MKIKRSFNGSESKMRNITKRNSSELLRVVTEDDNIVSTLLDIERASNDGVVALKNMNSIFKYIIGSTKNFPEQISDYLNTTEEIAGLTDDFYRNILDEQGQKDIQKAVPINKIRHLTSVINETSVPTVAAVGYIVAKYLEGLNSGLNNVKKILSTAYEQGELSEDVMRALGEVGLFEFEENSTSKIVGKFKRTASTKTEDDNISYANKFLNIQKRAETEEPSPFSGGGFGSSSLGRSNPFGGRSSGISSPFGGSSMKSFGGRSSGISSPFSSGLKSFGESSSSGRSNPFSGGLKSFGGSSSSSGRSNPFGGGLKSFGGTNRKRNPFK